MLNGQEVSKSNSEQIDHNLPLSTLLFNTRVETLKFWAFYGVIFLVYMSEAPLFIERERQMFTLTK